MDFGKLPDFSSVDFGLPSDHPGTPKLLKAFGPVPVPERKIYLGYTAWTHREWLGMLYPPDARTQDFLHHYASQFGTIELNTTFYRIPDNASVKRWKNSVTPGFRFCPKIFQDISHRNNLFNVKEMLAAFLKAMEGFGENLGPCFLQLPPNFGPALLPRLENFIHAWPGDFALGVEFRHESWFDRSPLAESGFDLLKAHGVSAVLTDVAGRRDVLHMHLTNPVAMLRFVGNSLATSDFSRSDEWAKRIAQWFQKGLKEVYVFLHQPDCSTIPQFGGYLLHALNRECQTKLKPLTLYNLGDEQASLF